MLRKVIKFTLVICCMLIIFMFSSDSGTVSSKKSDSVIINLGNTNYDKKADLVINGRVEEYLNRKYLK